MCLRKLKPASKLWPVSRLALQRDLNQRLATTIFTSVSWLPQFQYNDLYVKSQ